MGEGRHTPGPWTINAGRDGDYEIEAADPTMPDVPWSVAAITADCGYSNDTPANARLIAAAPDLLSALRDLLDVFVQLANSGDAGSLDPEAVAEVHDARAAIARAEARS